MRYLMWFCVLALAVALAVPAFAEVQNVKVSGDITVRALYQHAYDLDDSDDKTEPSTATDSENEENCYLSAVRLRVDADLTDNVSAMVRLLSQRQWDAESAADNAILIDNAYITLKELLYSPLTVTVGRQDVVYGDGFIVGAGFLADADAALAGYQEYSMDNGYDAIRAVLDYDPWTIDLLLAKIDEVDTAGGRNSGDRDLYGVEIGYAFDSYDAALAGYLFVDDDNTFNEKIDYSGSEDGNRTYEESITYCLGLRGELAPMDNLNVQGELAFQLGELVDQHLSGGDAEELAISDRDREAWAMDIAADYTWVDVTYTPSLMVEYVFRSGEENVEDGDLEAWNPMFSGKFYGLIYDFLQGKSSPDSDHTTGIHATDDSDDTTSSNNNHLVKVKGAIEPMDDLTLELAWLGIWFDEEPAASRDDEAGHEIDIIATYDYTEDVQFGLAAGFFMPGDYYEADDDDTAATVVGSVKVSF